MANPRGASIYNKCKVLYFDYSYLLLVVVLHIKFIEWNQCEWCYRVVTFGCQVSDQNSDVLFKLCQILDNVALVEVEAGLIMLFVCN